MIRLIVNIGSFLLVSAALLAEPLGTEFTYQGHLEQAGNPASGSFDFQFDLFNAASDGSNLGFLLREDVNVQDGIFTVELDFGTSPFTGEQLWLELGVRVGTSTDEFTELSPRQHLTATPFAIQAATVIDSSIDASNIVDGSVGSVQITDLSISTIDIATSAITQSKLAPDSVGSPEIIPDSIQAVDLATGSVGSSEIVASQVQRRITDTCDPGSVMVGVNEDGSVTCSALSASPVLTTVDDPANNVGEYNSIAIGNDGFPVISYYDKTAGALKVAKCNDAACTGGDEIITTVDNPANDVGSFTSIAIGTDNYPVISYVDNTAGSLKVAKCNDAACTGGGETITTVDDPANAVGPYSSIAIGTDGYPVISYMDQGDLTLKVAKCNDVACTGGGETITTVDGPGVGLYTSIAVASDGLPVISYYDFVGPGLKVAKCDDTACASESIITILDSLQLDSTSIALDVNNLPVISFGNSSSDSMGVAKCNDVACKGFDEFFNTLDGTVSGVFSSSIVMASDDLPVVSYFDDISNRLKIVVCNDDACGEDDEATRTLDESGHSVGRYNSVAIGSDGFPVVSYYDSTARALKVAKCGSVDCGN